MHPVAGLARDFDQLLQMQRELSVRALEQASRLHHDAVQTERRREHEIAVMANELHLRSRVRELEQSLLALEWSLDEGQGPRAGPAVNSGTVGHAATHPVARRFLEEVRASVREMSAGGPPFDGSWRSLTLAVIRSWRSRARLSSLRDIERVDAFQCELALPTTVVDAMAESLVHAVVSERPVAGAAIAGFESGTSIGVSLCVSLTRRDVAAGYEAGVEEPRKRLSEELGALVQLLGGTISLDWLDEGRLEARIALSSASLRVRLVGGFGRAGA